MEKNESTLGILRHSTSHIMAQAVQNLFKSKESLKVLIKM